ncbi:MAG: hypothetical protein RIR70_237 [Pseudomonadota bacterium]
MKMTGSTPPSLNLPVEGGPVSTSEASPRTPRISSPFGKKSYFVANTVPAGVTLSDRVGMGNKDACQYVLEAFSSQIDAPSKDRFLELVALIDANRANENADPAKNTAGADDKRKIELQRWAAGQVEELLRQGRR